MKLFVILSDNGLLKAGNTTHQTLDKLKANGFTPVSYNEDFLCALADEENAFFLPKMSRILKVCLMSVTSLA